MENIKLSDWGHLEELKVIDKLEEEYKKIELPKLQEQLKEFRKEVSVDYFNERRLEYLRRKRRFLEKHISEAKEHDKEMRQKFYNPVNPFSWLRLAIMELWQLPAFERELKRITFEIRLKENPDLIIKGQITEEMIAKAKEYPFENLIETNKAGFAKCPFHQEKTGSFYIKNNFGYCFGCQVSCDTIDFLMKTNNLSFIEVVKALQ